MATRIIGGPRKWEGGVDSSGYRTYKIAFRVQGAVTDGPFAAMSTPGLPREGDTWDFDDDFDPWAFCTAEIDVKPDLEDEPNVGWTLTYTFTTKPNTDKGRGCNDAPVEDPLLQPAKFSGSFTKFQEESTVDRFGAPTNSSSHEQLRGPQNEWDASRSVVEVEQNVPDLQLPLLNALNDTLNQYVMWGMPPRTIKCSILPWEKKYFGTCYAYYTRKTSFELKKDGWDRNVLDEGTKVLHGHWDDETGTDPGWVLDDIGGSPPDPDNPQHFDRAKDRNGENIKVVLNGSGSPVGAHETGTITNAESSGEDGDAIAVTSGAHGLSEGATVSITGVLEPSSLNGTWKIHVTSADEFTVPGIASSAYAGGGTWRELPGNVHVEKYGEADLQFLLDLPSSF